jgi:hypothetical protein
MDTGKIITALIKEYTTESPNKMAIYYDKYRVSVKGVNYLFEMKDENDIYKSMIT